MPTAYRPFHLGDVHLSVWHARAEPSDVEALGAELRQLARLRPQIGLVLVIPAEVGLSSDEARRAAQRMLRELRPAIAAVAVVILGDGFRGAAIRAMFSSLGLLLRPGFPWKMFGDIADVEPWLRPVLEAQDVRCPLAPHLAAAAATRTDHRTPAVRTG